MQRANRRAQRPVVGGAEQADHNVRDHDSARASEQQRGKKVSQAEHESESCAREHSRNRERQDHAPERLRWRGSEIVRGFDQVARDVLERRVNGKKRKRRVDVREREHHRKWTVEQEFQRMMREVNILQQRVQHAVGAEDRLPGVGAN